MSKNTKLYENRLIHYDLMRVIACFCVIMIHVGMYKQSVTWDNQSFELLIGNFYEIISRWAVPCFVMLSGIMFLNNNKHIPIKKLYGKYILRLFVSYVFWSFVYALYNSFYETNLSISEMFYYFINNCFSGEIHMWYVLMTIGLYIIIPIIKFFLNNASQQLIKYWILIMFVFASLIPFLSNLNITYISGVISYLYKYMEIYFLCGYTMFFVIGYYLSKYELSSKTKKIIYILGVCGFIYSIMILIVLKYYVNLQFGALNYLYPNVIFMSIAVMLFFMDKVSKFNFGNRAKSIIVNLSKLSYGIFLIHVLILKVLFHFGITVLICNMAISAPLISLITFIIAAIIIFLISKIPFINKYIC